MWTAQVNPEPLPFVLLVSLKSHLSPVPCLNRFRLLVLPVCMWMIMAVEFSSTFFDLP